MMGICSAEKMPKTWIPFRRPPPPTYNVSKPYYCGMLGCENELPCEFRFKISQHIDAVRKTRAKKCPFSIEEVLAEVQDTPIEYSSEW